MVDTMNGVPIGDLPGIESVPDDSLLVVEFLGKAYSMPGAVLRQLFLDILDAMGGSVDDVTEARLIAAIETVLASGKYNGISPVVEITTTEDGTDVIHVVDASGIKDYPISVLGAKNAVQYIEQILTEGQKAQARKNIDAEKAGAADALKAVSYEAQTLTDEQKARARMNIGAAHDNVYVVAFSDAKYSEIKSAYDAGKLCFVQYNTLTCSMTGITEEYAQFVGGFIGGNVMRLRIKSSGVNENEIVSLDAVQYTAQTLTEAQKEQARTNIGAADAETVKTIKETVNKIGDITATTVLVALSGNHNDGYTVLLDGEAVTGDALNEMIQAGKIVIGVAASEMKFLLATGLLYRVAAGTLFQYGNATVSFEYGSHGLEFCAQMEDNDFALFYQDDGWVGKAQTSHITFHLLRQYADDKMIRYNDERLTASEAYKLLFDAMYRARPIYCYQENAVFYAEDGSEHKPYINTAFQFNQADYSFRCEQDGYEYTLLISATEGYTPTATKTTPYKTAESKADGLEADTETHQLFLLSAGERISDPVPIPSGGTDDAVQYVEQTLTETQKARARKNIGALAPGDLDWLPIIEQDTTTFGNALTQIAIPNSNGYMSSNLENLSFEDLNGVSEIKLTMFGEDGLGYPLGAGGVTLPLELVGVSYIAGNKSLINSSNEDTGEPIALAVSAFGFTTIRTTEEWYGNYRVFGSYSKPKYNQLPDEFLSDKAKPESITVEGGATNDTVAAISTAVETGKTVFWKNTDDSYTYRVLDLYYDSFDGWHKILLAKGSGLDGGLYYLYYNYNYYDSETGSALRLVPIFAPNGGVRFLRFDSVTTAKELLLNVNSDGNATITDVEENTTKTLATLEDLEDTACVTDTEIAQLQAALQ